MRKTSTQSLSRKRFLPNKLAMGLMVAAVSVLVGTAGVAGATSGHGLSGFGYGGGGINIDLGQILGDHNIVVIIINYFVGGH